MERVQGAHYDNSHDSEALLRLLINDCTTHHTQPNTKHTHTHTQKKEKKKTCKKKKKERKERQPKKAKYASIKQRKFRKNMVLINLQLIFINKN